MTQVTEEWKPIADIAVGYKVSSLGNVRRWLPSGAGGSYRLSAISTQSKGYKQVHLSTASGGRRFYVHRLVAHAFLGSCPPGKEVNHRDGNKANNAISNLEYLTHKENYYHAVKTGLYRCPHQKLTDAHVAEISVLLETHSARELTQFYPASRSTISSIRTGYRADAIAAQKV